jgi:hypothetical protein
MYITRNIDWYGGGEPEASFASPTPDFSVRDSWLK